MATAVICPCGERFVVGAVTFPRTVSCHSCGRRAVLAGPLALSNGVGWQVAAQPEEKANDRPPATTPPPARERPWRRRPWLVVLAATLLAAAFLTGRASNRQAPPPHSEVRIGRQPISAWLDDLRSPERGDAASRALPLFARRSPDVAAALRRALAEDDESTFRENVARALCALVPHDPEAYTALREAVRDPSEKRAGAVVRGLHANAEEVVPLLAEGLRHPTVSVRIAAVERLHFAVSVEVAIPELLAAQKDVPDVARRAATVLTRVRRPTREVIEALADAAPEALASLPRQAEVVVPALTAMLRHPRADRRLGAARGLKGLAAWAALPALKRALKEDSDVRVRKQAVVALHAVASPYPGAILAELHGALVDKDEGVRRAAAARLRQTETGPFLLIEEMKGPRVDAHQSVVAELKEGGVTARDLPLLLAALRGPDAGSRRAAVPLLRRLFGRYVEPRLDRAAQRDALPMLIACLAEDDLRWPVAALLRDHWNEQLDYHQGGDFWAGLVRARSAFRSALAVRDLVAGLRDKDEDRRRAAAVALVLAGQAAAEAIPFYVEKDPNGALVELIGPEGREAVPALARLVAKGPRSARAVRALGRIGPDAAAAATALGKAIEEGRDVIDVLDALTRIGPGAAAAAPAVQALAAEPRWTKLAAETLVFLEARDQAALPRLATLLREAEGGTVARAARAMARIDAKAAVEAASALARDRGPLRWRGHEALRALGAALAVPALRELTRAERGVASEAAVALSRLSRAPADQALAISVLLRRPDDFWRSLGPATWPALLEVVDRVDEGGRAILAGGLAGLIRHRPALTPQVLKALDHPSPAARRVVIAALGEARPAWPGVVPALVACAQQKNEVGRAAVAALNGAGPEALAFLSARAASGLEDATRALSSCGPAAVPALRRALEVGGAPARREAVNQLAGFPAELAPAEWAGLLRDPDEVVRDRALDVLLGKGLWPGPEVRQARRDALHEHTRALSHPAPELRRRACERLARLGPDAIPALIEAVGDPKVRWTAIEALGGRFEMPPQAEPAIRAALDADLGAAEGEEARAAIRARYEWALRPPPRPLPTSPADLARLAADRDGGGGRHIRARALLALSQMGPQPPEVVRDVLRSYAHCDEVARDAWRMALKAIDPEVAGELGLR
jgi:HEAT repeat protein